MTKGADAITYTDEDAESRKSGNTDPDTIFMNEVMKMVQPLYLTKADFRTELRIAIDLAEATKKTKEYHRATFKLKPADLGKVYPDVGFKNVLGLIASTTLGKLLPLSTKLDDYDHVYNAANLSPKIPDMQKYLSIDMKGAPAQLQEGFKVKNYELIDSAIIAEQEGTLDRIFSQCGSNIKMSILVSAFILNEDLRLQILLYMLRNEHKMGLIATLKNLYEIPNERQFLDLLE